MSVDANGKIRQWIYNDNLDRHKEIQSHVRQYGGNVRPGQGLLESEMLNKLLKYPQQILLLHGGRKFF